MPVCPGCQTPYDSGQHFCKQCGLDLRVEPLASPRCPRCGTQVSPEQNFCQECDAPLKEGIIRQAASASRRWLIGGIVAAVLILGIILVVQLTRPPSPSPAPPAAVSVQPLHEAGKPLAQVPAVLSPPAAGTAAPLSADLEKVLNNLKEANLSKDIILYMSNLSFLYPQLDKKRQDTLKTWEKYDFKKMAFTITKIQELGGDDAVAEVSWSTLSQNLSTRDLQTDDFQYSVWFTKELGQWKIKKIEELEP